MKIGLIGDYQADVAAHFAIPRALELAAGELSLSVTLAWLPSSEVSDDRLSQFAALWCVPASPYASPQGVIDAIRYAREADLPFLGTCGGYQHALLEFARNVLGHAQAESSEDNPATEMALISALRCRLAGESDAINLRRGSRAAKIYRCERIREEYNCGYGLNVEYLPLFDGSQLRFSGFDDNGDPRIAEIPAHRFFIATAFQPERSAFRKIAHPLIVEYLRSVA